MKEFPIFQVDAFASERFKGNPAAVIPLQEWLPDHLMQQIALENNLSETVFFVPTPGTDAHFHIRWFTPLVEINLCGHATLAAAFVLYNHLNYEREAIVFKSQSGLLKVHCKDDLIWMDFPRWQPERMQDGYENIITALGINEVLGVYRNRDVIVEFVDEKSVLDCKPDFTALKKTGANVIVTSPGTGDIDFVSRFFGPAVGVDEDPVTGSAHAQLIPFWREKLGKETLQARQLSARGGDLVCIDHSNRVMIGGQCVLFMRGVIMID